MGYKVESGREVGLSLEKVAMTGRRYVLGVRISHMYLAIPLWLVTWIG